MWGKTLCTEFVRSRITLIRGNEVHVNQARGKRNEKRMRITGLRFVLVIVTLAQNCILRQKNVAISRTNVTNLKKKILPT